MNGEYNDHICECGWPAPYRHASGWKCPPCASKTAGPLELDMRPLEAQAAMADFRVPRYSFKSRGLLMAFLKAARV